MSQELVVLLFVLIATILAAGMLAGWVSLNAGTIAVAALALFGAGIPKTFQMSGRYPPPGTSFVSPGACPPPGLSRQAGCDLAALFPLAADNPAPQQARVTVGIRDYPATRIEHHRRAGLRRIGRPGRDRRISRIA